MEPRQDTAEKAIPGSHDTPDEFYRTTNDFREVTGMSDVTEPEQEDVFRDTSLRVLTMETFGDRAGSLQQGAPVPPASSCGFRGPSERITCPDDPQPERVWRLTPPLRTRPRGVHPGTDNGGGATTADDSNGGKSASSSAKPEKEKLSWHEWFRAVYSWTWKPIIRPPRETYDIADLGRTQFVFRGRAFVRDDLDVKNFRGQRLSCSHFRQVRQNSPMKQNCVVYLHGSSSSRLESFDVLPVLLPAGLSVFSLDFSGSGQSDGDYISLGLREQEDLRAVVEYLRSCDYVGNVGCWGRSMGATAAVFRAAQDHDLGAVILDSAYADLKMNIAEFLQNAKVNLPSFLMDALIAWVRQEVKSRADFDIFDCAAIQYAEKAVCPALFAVAADDNFVFPHHTQELHNKWGGDRLLRFFEGGHNGRRPKWFLDEASQFLADKLAEWKPPSSKDERTSLDVDEARRRAYWL